MFKALFSSRRESCIHPASFSKCYGVYDLNKKYQSLETPKEKSEKREKNRDWGAHKKRGGWVCMLKSLCETSKTSTNY